MFFSIDNSKNLQFATTMSKANRRTLKNKIKSVKRPVPLTPQKTIKVMTKVDDIFYETRIGFSSVEIDTI
jgi:hypothetical protein